MSAEMLLIELGTEELPPGSLRTLAESLCAGIVARLDEQRITHGAARWFATPRRLAVQIDAVSALQPDSVHEKLGPAVAAAFDKDGKPTPAALGFARGCGVAVEDLARADGDKGPRLAFRSAVAGQPTALLLPALLDAALGALPIAKRMRWGAARAEFVRPVHWLVILHGSTVVPARVLGIDSGRTTRGHRIHGEARIDIAAAADYERVLLERGKVIADYAARRAMIAADVAATAQGFGGNAVLGDDLLDEVCSLVEWPRALAGRFEERFLAVPAEALVSTMRQHQKYFHVVAADGALMPYFITVANIESSDPAKVIAGNERVIRPRLADAEFFFTQDQKITLAERRERLRTVVYQAGLGTTYAKTERVASLAGAIGTLTGTDAALCARAGELCKADLVADMVQEFDELQGIMGMYYARLDGEPAAVAEALREQYLPRHAGDELPASAVGMALALADRLDTLVGIFGLGQVPSGSKDPFGLRRAALGVLRILLEKELPLDLQPLLEHAAASFEALPQGATVVATVRDYILERLRAVYADAGIGTECFLAVQARGITQPLDFDRRVRAVASFLGMPEAASLAGANKRVANLLAKQDGAGTIADVDRGLFADAAEATLADALADARAAARPLLDAGDYAGALRVLARLRVPVDGFFEQVLVMAEDPAVRANRLALLAGLRASFLEVADISLLAVSA